MSKFLPNREDLQEESLQPVFEKNTSYLKSKKSSLNQFVKTNLKTQNIFAKTRENLKSLFSNRIIVLGLGFASSLVVVGILIALVLSQAGAGKNITNNLANIINPFSPINASAQEIEIKPNTKTNLGVDSNSTYTITSANSITEKQIKDNLKLTPSLPYELKKNSDTNYELNLTQKPTANEVVKFELKVIPDKNDVTSAKNLSWAYQVKDEFRILGTTPTNKVNGVPANTGIEVVFNTDSYNDIDQFFEITPKVEGTFKRNGRVAVFIPKNLEKNTVYTVKIKQGLTTKDNSGKLAQDYLFQFQTINDDPEYKEFSLINTFIEYKPAEQIVVPVFSTFEDLKTTVSIYNFKSEEQINTTLNNYISNFNNWQNFQPTTFYPNTTELNKVSSQNYTITKTTPSEQYIDTTKGLEKGIYLLEVESNGKKVQSILQITNLVGFIQETKTENLIWLQNLTTKSPAANAKIQVANSDKFFTSNDQGIAIFPKIQDSIYFYNITSEDQRLILIKTRTENLNIYSTDQSQDYWSHLYSDRSIYRPSDKIQFWGVLKNRVNAKNSEEIKAVISKQDYSVMSYKKVEIISKNLKTEQNIFNSDFIIDNATTGNYILDIFDSQNNLIKSNYFRVENFIAPSYKITAGPEKKAYFAGESATIRGQASFFEETPVNNLDISYSYGNNQTPIIKTNQEGKFNFQVPLVKKSDQSNDGINQAYITITPALSEEFDSALYQNVLYFDNKTYVDINSEIKQNKGTIKIGLNEIDLSKINNGTAKDDKDFKGVSVANKKVKITLFEYKYERYVSGQYYDLISKKTVNNYSYNRVYVGQKSFSPSTNTEGLINLDFPVDPTHNFDINIETTDKDGSPIEFKRGLYGTVNSGSGYTAKDMIYTLKMEEKKYKIGETAKFKIQPIEGPELIETKQNQFLVSYLQNGQKSYKLQNNPNFELKFEENSVPNMNLLGVYFDGNTFNITGVGNLEFEKESRKLKISVTPDKKEYKPKDTVKLDIDVKNQENNPIEANVNISVVDEAIMQYSPNEPNILEDIYKHLYSGLEFVHASHKVFMSQTGDGGQGNGGGTSLRDKFLDTAIFKQVKADNQGKAKLEFQLPDNLTSWRITYEAITEKLEADSGKININVKQPFFATAVINDIYYENDKPTIKLRGFGTNLPADQSVNFTINSESLNIKNKIVESKGSNPVDFELPNLPIGKHKFNIAAKSGDQVDNLTREINVLSPQITKTEVKYFTPEELQKFKVSDNTKLALTFQNQTSSEYYQRLTELQNQSGDRLDQKLARDISTEFLNRYFTQSAAINSNNDYTLYQNPSNGWAIYPYSSPDLETSVYAIGIGKNKFENETLKSYLNKVITDPNESRERKIIALYGLSKLKDNALNQINEVAGIVDLSPKEQLFTALAFIEAENKEAARKIYTDLLNKYQIKEDRSISLKIGESPDEISYYTLLESLLGAKLNEDQSKNLYRYYLANQPKTNIYYGLELETIESILNYQKPQKVEFNFKQNEQNISKKLENNQSYSIEINSQDLAKLDLKVISGQLGIVTNYQTPIKDITNNKDLNLDLKFYQNDKETNSLNDADLVKVEANYVADQSKIDNSCYEASIYLPAGLKTTSKTPGDAWVYSKEVWYPYSTDNQKTSFCIGKESKGPIVFYARVINKGEFKSPKSTIQSLKTLDSISFSQEKTVKIQ